MTLKVIKPKKQKYDSLVMNAVNATIQLDVTPNGRPKFNILLDLFSGTAIDRIQECNDIVSHLDMKSTMTNDHLIFINDDKTLFVAYKFYPDGNGDVCILTSKCHRRQSNEDLTEDKAIDLLLDGLREAEQESLKISKKMKPHLFA